MRVASLGSGSRGNATVVSSGDSVVLIDCGFSVRETKRRLARLGVTPEDLDAILVTHEHGDHIAGVSRLASRFGITVYCSHGTAVSARLERLESLTRLLCQDPFSVGDLEIQPFTVPHDAREPLQFCCSDGDRTFGMLTDSGHITSHIRAVLARCDALVIETNHDAQMLAEGPYHRALKERVGSDYGHLENEQAAGLLRQVSTDRLQHVIAAHLSEQNNTPDLARSALADALGCPPSWIQVADQDYGIGWREVV